MRRLLSVLALGLGLLIFASPAHGVTQKTTRFVASFEGFSSCVYADPAGHATIGFGHLLHYGPPTTRDRRKWGCLTRARALKLLRKDLRTFEGAVLARLRGTKITPARLTALTSFAFNLGAGALDSQKHRGTGKVTSIARMVRNGRYRRAGKQMLLYNGVIINGKRYVLQGLRIRRRKEFRLMVKDIGRVEPCRTNCPGGGGIGSRAVSGGLTLR